MTVVVAALSYGSYHVAYNQFEQGAVETSRERLSLYDASLQSTLDRVSHLPRVVRLNKEARRVLRGEATPDELNRYLKSVSDAAGSAALYVLDAEATTVAASNFDTHESFVGNNYRFRRYFTDAVATGSGRFFAVGVTTARPGYFFSEAIIEDGRAIGVAVVKVEFLELLSVWKDANENVLISDKDDVIILASNHDRLYHTLRQIPPLRLNEMQKTRKFSGFTLEPLDFRSETSDFSGAIELDGDHFIVTTANTSRNGWKLHFLTPLKPVQQSALVFGSIVFLLSGLAVIGGLYTRSRLQQDRLRLIEAEAKRVQDANIRLENEVGERKRTEKQLRDTQAELIQSSRLAALGKMSAAIVHEVNQPVSAIRMFTASGGLLLKESRLEEADTVFQQIRKMTERLGAITSDLLIFSRKPISKPSICDLNRCVEEILIQFEPELDAAGGVVRTNLSETAVCVRGSEVRFEQLVSNLVRNALQASLGKSKPEIVISTWVDGDKAGLSVSDNGEGIAPEFKDQLFDPFFTTKDIGKGVGLGLALCYAIADEASGRISCDNRDGGGAIFTVEFPFAQAKMKRNSGELVDA